MQPPVRALGLPLASLLACGPASLPGDTDGATTSAGSDSSDGGETAGTTGDPGEPAGGCVDDGALTRSLAILDADAAVVRVASPAGDRTLSAALPGDVDADARIIAATRGPYLAVASSYTIYKGPGDLDEAAAVRLYEHESGALLWEHVLTRSVNQLYVDAQARVTAELDLRPGGPAGLTIIDGQATALPRFAPRGPIGPEGQIPGRRLDAAQETYEAVGFIDLATAAFTPVVAATSQWWILDGAIEHLDPEASPPRFTVTRPGGAAVHELTPYADLGAWVWREHSAGDFRLFAADLDLDGNHADLLVRLDVESGAQVVASSEPPPGLSRFDCYPEVRVDVEGRVLFELRDAGSARVHAWDPGQASWSALGQAMTGIEAITLHPASGRVQVIEGSGPNTTFCGLSEWIDPPASALVGASFQLARVEPPLALATASAPTVTDDERCAVWAEEGGLRIYDLEDGDALTLPSSGAALWLE
ncbi:MAG: hypothetical protein R3B09_23675 [Nannocystaceae bacterium]